ncbi:MAG: class I SAM-dependent methyltransferase [Alphaproteobacteria bacterium]|nr:class I SAM-dependent methyltransferase [Alphaproteobacteria bacterium]
MFYDTDKMWEKWGRRDAYYGVLANERYRGALDDDARGDFFATGARHFTQIVDDIHHHLDAGFRPRASLDFGCGVGRILIPIAEASDSCTGVDVSPAMLDEAAANCDDRGLANVTLIRSDDDLSAVDGGYDFIHSYIVFQHIPVRRGEHIFDRLLDRLVAGGVAVVHFTYAREDWFKQALSPLRGLPLAPNCLNLIKGKPFLDPPMERNAYSLNRLFAILQRHGMVRTYVKYTNHSGYLGVVLYAQKDAA